MPDRGAERAQRELAAGLPGGTPPFPEPLNTLLAIARSAATATELARAGLAALRQHDLDAWTAWRDAVAASDINQLKRFLRGLQSDRYAVTNTLLTTLSNAKPPTVGVEGSPSLYASPQQSDGQG